MQVQWRRPQTTADTSHAAQCSYTREIFQGYVLNISAIRIYLQGTLGYASYVHPYLISNILEHAIHVLYSWNILCYAGDRFSVFSLHQTKRISGWYFEISQSPCFPFFCHRQSNSLREDAASNAERQRNIKVQNCLTVVTESFLSNLSKLFILNIKIILQCQKSRKNKSRNSC